MTLPRSARPSGSRPTIRAAVGLLLALAFGWLLAGPALAAEPARESGIAPPDLLPVHGQVVLDAVAARLAGAEPALVAADLGVAGIEAIRPETEFHYEGFDLAEIVIDRFAADRKTSGRFSVAGELRWKDVIGRRAATRFAANYRVEGKRLAIEWAQARPLFAEQPAIRAFLYPAEAIRAIESDANDLFAGLFLKAYQPEVPVIVGPERDYALLVFVMDRMDPAGTYEFRLAEQAEGSDGEAGHFRYRGYEPGWFVGAALIHGQGVTRPPSLWIKAVRTEKASGLFSTDKNHLLARVPVGFAD
ncbi:hypothetical protein OCH7691_01567 [Oceanibacterium hippocampi]|uniref:Uncharacterized protein n=1 Tax=Oceanibacterium hippocampi TaxID=745714 RepID=A0A1Y5SDA2_9PROT|nr:hypothetical protein OCH7691_01567 [Oceanibacterium hippocampi]